MSGSAARLVSGMGARIRRAARVGGVRSAVSRASRGARWSADRLAVAFDQAWPRSTAMLETGSGASVDLAQSPHGRRDVMETVAGWPGGVDAGVSVADRLASLMAESYCPRCGMTWPDAAITAEGCGNCTGRRLAWQRLTRLCAYEPPVREWIKGLKFRRQWYWAGALGQRLGRRLELPFGDERVIVAAVPMHWQRRWQRGYNQAGLIADALARAGGWTRLDVLRRARPTQPQSLIYAVDERRRNLARAIRPRPVDLSGCQVVLVDDVTTTGSTLTACCRALQAMGPGGPKLIRVAVLCVADTKLRGRGA